MHLTSGSHSQGCAGLSQVPTRFSSHREPGFNTRLIESQFDLVKKVQRWKMYRNDDINRSNQRKRTTNNRRRQMTMMSWLELTGPAPGSDDKARLCLAYLCPCPEASCGDNTFIDRPFCSLRVRFCSVLFSLVSLGLSLSHDSAALRN